jgi:hypothetical protein
MTMTHVVARGMEGKLGCRLNLWRKRQLIYTGVRGLWALAGMLAEPLQLVPTQLKHTSHPV